MAARPGLLRVVLGVRKYPSSGVKPFAPSGDSAAMAAQPAAAHLRKKISSMQGFHSYYRFPGPDPLKVVGSRCFSSCNKSRLPLSLTFEECKIKLKAFAKKSWDSMDPRVQNALIDGWPKCLILLGSGHGYLLYLGTITKRVDRIEALLDQMKEDSEKANSEIKAEVESVSRFLEESEVKREKVEAEVRELRFLKELTLGL